MVFYYFTSIIAWHRTLACNVPTTRWRMIPGKKKANGTRPTESFPYSQPRRDLNKVGWRGHWSNCVLPPTWILFLLGLVWGRSDPLRWELQAWSICLWVGPPQVRVWDSLSFMKYDIDIYWHYIDIYWLYGFNSYLPCSLKFWELELGSPPGFREEHVPHILQRYGAQPGGRMTSGWHPVSCSS